MSQTPRENTDTPAPIPAPMPWHERIAYAVVLGSIVLMVVIVLPALVWPEVMGRFMAAPTWLVILFASYLIAPYAHRYIKRTKYG